MARFVANNSLQKQCVRVLKWTETYNQLPSIFHSTYHWFLANTGDDIPILQEMEITNDWLFAIENSQEVFELLSTKYKGTGINLRSKDIWRSLVEHGQKQNNGSIDIDFQGLWRLGNIRTTINVIRYLTHGRVLNITLERARDNTIHSVKECIERMVGDIKTHTNIQVSPTQIILYQSRHDDKNGSPMISITFIIGVKTKEPNVIDIRHLNPKELNDLIEDKWKQFKRTYYENKERT